MDVRSLQRAQLQRALDKADAALSVLCREFIAQGRGHERTLDILAQSDPLSLKYRAASDAYRALSTERDRRMTYHGSMNRTKGD